MQIPSVLEVQALTKKMINLLGHKGIFPWAPRDQEVLTVLIHAATEDVEEVSFRENGSIWATPGQWQDGTRSMPCALLSCLDDRTSDNKYVREEGFHRLGRHPFDFLKKIADEAGCRAHTAERIETARRLDVSSSDGLSYPFYLAVRRSISLNSPHDDKYLIDASRYLSVTIRGLLLPELTGHDHPNRLAYAARSRSKVIQRLLELQPDVELSCLSDHFRDALLTKTNVFWWSGFAAEFFLIDKLTRKGLLVNY